MFIVTGMGFRSSAVDYWQNNLDLHGKVTKQTNKNLAMIPEFLTVRMRHGWLLITQLQSQTQHQAVVFPYFKKSLRMFLQVEFQNVQFS